MNNLKKYIYENINNYEHNHADIINLIKVNNINYSQNNNGIFINISKLDYEILNEIKKLMTSKSISLDFERELIINEMKNNEIESDNEDYFEENIKTFKKVSINNDIEKNILKYSKVYKLNGCIVEKNK
tara:strand:+ start:424 stop:810 length:387 start_codon:yes stop_codon:yes gene_type:complete